MSISGIKHIDQEEQRIPAFFLSYFRISKLIYYLTEEAKKFRTDTNAISRNEHLTGIGADYLPTARQIDGILVAFINHIGISQSIDYALSYKDL